MNPLNIADKIDALAADALTSISSVAKDAKDSELNQTLDDIQIMVALGRYYAEKFRGARDLQFAEMDKADPAKSAAARASAVNHLTRALALWTTYADLSAQRYFPTFHSRIKSFDPKAATAYVAGDIAIANQLTAGGPTVTTQPQIVSQTGATATLSVRGDSESDRESQLKYYWTLIGTRPAGVSYTNMENNAARDTTVTFAKSGRYRFKAIVLDSNNRYEDSKSIEIIYDDATVK